MKPEFLMKAQTYDPKKYGVGGYFWSEKLDGTRAFWDGGISRGRPTKDVPYANTIKDARLKEEPIATGLWSLSGKVIHAPDEWLANLPLNLMLDGELYAGHGNFQEVRKTVSGLPGRTNWNNIDYMVFDIPSATEMFKPREIKIRNEYSFFVKEEALQWALDKGIRLVYDDLGFETRDILLKSKFKDGKIVKAVKNTRLPVSNTVAETALVGILNSVVERGGEGVILRWAPSKWSAIRSHHILKYKPFDTADGTVVGYFAGEEGKTGQLLGKIGAVLLSLDNGGFLKLSGFTHKQREILDSEIKAWSEDHPGELMPFGYEHHIFKIADTVEFKYRELSYDGIPKEARFFRVKE